MGIARKKGNINSIRGEIYLGWTHDTFIIMVRKQEDVQVFPKCIVISYSMSEDQITFLFLCVFSF